MKSLTLVSIFAVLAAAVVFSAGGSHAGAADCSSAATQVAITACEGAAAKAADAGMGVTYAAALHGLPQQRRSSLAAAQTAWRQYRAKECAFEAGAYAGGSLMPSAAAACHASVTNARTVQLRALLLQLKAG